MRYVYILRSISCPWRHYVGVTLDPDRRLVAHNAGMSSHTSKYRPWSIIVAIRFEDDARAFGFEKYLKSPSGCAFRRFRPPEPRRSRPAFREDSGHPRSVSDAGDYCFSHWPISVNLCCPFFFRMDSPLRAIL